MFLVNDLSAKITKYAVQVSLVVHERLGLQKSRLAYNEFTFEKANNDCKLEDRFQNKAISQSDICKIADKKTAYNDGRLYF